MVDVNVKLNLDGVRAIMSCKELEKLLKEKSEAIAQEAQAQSANYQASNPKYYEAERFKSEVEHHEKSHGILIAHVWANGIFGRAACAKGPALTNALDAGR